MQPNSKSVRLHGLLKVCRPGCPHPAHPGSGHECENALNKGRSVIVESWRLSSALLTQDSLLSGKYFQPLDCCQTIYRYRQVDDRLPLSPSPSINISQFGFKVEERTLLDRRLESLSGIQRDGVDLLVGLLTGYRL